MRVFSVLGDLAGAEWRSIHRDSLLRWMLVPLFGLTFLTRWALPWASVRFNVDIAPHYPLVMSVFVVLFVPIFVGFIVGMLLLDERDEGTLQAMSVTPLPTWQYLGWKLLWPVVLATIVSSLTFPIIGVMALEWKYVTALFVAAMWTPMLALIMSCFARNKVQGLVLMRISSVVLLIPMFAWFFPNWEPFLTCFPAYWPMKSLWLAAEGKSSLICFMVGTVFHLGLILLLYRRFQVVLRRSE